MKDSILNSLEINSKKFPNKNLFKFNEEKMTYLEFWKLVSQWEALLLNLKLQEGSSLAFLSANHPSFMVLFFACMKARISFVPIDPSLKIEEAEKIIDLAKPNIFLIHDSVDSKKYEKMSVHKNIVKSLDLAEEIVLTKYDHHYPSKTALVLLTSGSTGIPKGVLLNHETVDYRYTLVIEPSGITENIKVLCSIPLSHSYAFDLLLPAMVIGGEIILMEPMHSLPTTVFKLIEQEKVTVYSAIPFFYKLATMIPPHLNFDLSSLSYLHTGSAPLLPGVGEMIWDRFKVKIKQGYGLTESGFSFFNADLEGNSSYESIGKPWPGVEAKIDEQGQLLLKSDALFDGYLNDPKAYEEKFHGEWFCTHDLVELDNHGNYYIIGRLSDFINVTGNKVYPLEIEKMVSTFTEVELVAVTSFPDSIKGEVPILHIVFKKGLVESEDLIIQRILNDLRSKLSDYKVPVDVVVHKSFELSQIGKILKLKLAEDYKVKKLLQKLSGR